MPGIVGLTDLIERYFYSSQWLWIFIGSLVYLFVRANSAHKRAFLAALAVFFLFVNSIVIEKFSALGENGTFYRHLWAIPSIVIVGIAIVDLIKIMPKWYLKIPVIVAVVVGVWFVNSHEYIRLRDLPLSTDGKMVSEDVIQLSEGFEKLRKESGKNTLFIVCGNQATELALYNGFLDISSSSILNDAEHNGELELMGDNPDVEFIMSTCCAKGRDYVIAARNENSDDLYLRIGNEPVLETDSYYVYKCKGYNGYSQDINRWGLISWLQYYDDKGMPCLNNNGFCRLSYEYDSKGRVMSEEYYDQNEKPIKRDKGYAKRTVEYIDRYHTVERYYDEEDQLTLANFGYAGIKCTLDDKRRIIKGTFLGTDGLPMTVTNGFASCTNTYDETGNKLSECYLDINGDYINCISGYAMVFWEYNANNKPFKTVFFDSKRQITENKDGWAMSIKEYDEAGNNTVELFLDKNGDDTLTIYGYSKVLRIFDEKNRLIKELYVDTDGRIINNNQGYAGFERIYDEDSLVEERKIYAEEIEP